MLKKISKIIIILLAMIVPVSFFMHFNKPADKEILQITSAQPTFFIGDTFNQNNLEFTLHYSDNTTEKIKISSEMINGFDTSTTGEKTLTVTHGSQTYAVRYVVVEPKITSIAVKTPFDTEYYEGESLDISGGVITATYDNGQTTDINITASMVSGFNSATTSTSRSFTITYKDLNNRTHTTTLAYVVKPLTVKTLELNEDFPSPLNFYIGDSLDLFGKTLIVTFMNDTVKEIPLTKTPVFFNSSTDSVVQSGNNLTFTLVSESETTTVTHSFESEPIIIADFNSKTEGSKALTIIYKYIHGESEVVIPYEVIEPNVEEIALQTPFKSTYYTGEPLDVTGGKLSITYVTGTTIDNIDITGDMITAGFSTATAGTKSMTITYHGVSIQKSYTVIPWRVVDIAIKTPFKTTYYVGDALDFTGGVITATWNNGVTADLELTQELIDQYSIDLSGFDSSKPNVNGKLTVSYEDAQLTVDYVVEAIVATSIELATPFTKTTYIKGDLLDVSGATITVKYNNNPAGEVIPVTADMVTNFNSATVGNNLKLTITYKFNSIQVNYNVIELAVVTKTISTTFKTEYYQGELIDTTGGKLSFTLNNGESGTVDITTSMIQNYISNAEGTDLIATVRYLHPTAGVIKVDFTYTIYKCTITVTTPFETEYSVGDELDISGGKITIDYHGRKTNETINITADMVSGFDSTSATGEFNRQLTITYLGKSTYVMYSVS